MSKAAWRRQLAVVERANRSSPRGFDAYWRAVAAILADEHWRHDDELRTERQCIQRHLDEPRRRARRLARLAAHGTAWPYRGTRNSALRVHAKNVEQHARVGTTNLEDAPVVHGRGRNLAAVERHDAPLRAVRRETRRLRRMSDGGARSGKLVLLLHGLGRTRYSMRTLEKPLTANGFHAVRIGYRSTRAGTVELADRAWSHAAQVAERFERVHFVTHSMGGILARRAENLSGNTVFLRRSSWAVSCGLGCSR